MARPLLPHAAPRIPTMAGRRAPSAPPGGRGPSCEAPRRPWMRPPTDMTSNSTLALPGASTGTATVSIDPSGDSCTCISTAPSSSASLLASRLFVKSTGTGCTDLIRLGAALIVQAAPPDALADSSVSARSIPLRN
eukprot:1136454-Pleurochrysis_carterae.AAC.1